MDFSFSNRTLILSKRFWILEDKSVFDTKEYNCKLKTNERSNGICYKEKVNEKCSSNIATQKHGKSNTEAKIKYLKLLTFATNLTLILICVSALSDRAYRCIARYFLVKSI